jgi:hypothetical protein
MSAQTPRPAGVHPESVSEMLGPSTVSIALDIYSHVTRTMQREAAAVIGSEFSRGRGSHPSDRDRSVMSGRRDSNHLLPR